METVVEKALTSVFKDTVNCIEKLDINVLEPAVNAVMEALHTGRKLYFTGIGKPSYVAMKQAATCKSIMIDAEYMDACTAGHGDLGPVTNGLLIAYSKSGLSSELYGLFKVMKQLRPDCKIMLICMSTDEQLAKVKLQGENIDIICRLNCEPKELDLFGCIPSTSNAMFEIATSAILRAAMSYDGDLDVNILTALKKSHPSGTLQNKVTEVLANMAM